MTTASNHSFSRRRLLRGLSVCLALPWLESLPAGEPAPAGSTPLQGPPRRFATCYVGNGVVGWDATQGAGGIAFANALAPFTPHAAAINVLQGLEHTRMMKTSVATHATHSATILSGATPNKSTTEVRAGISMDQVLAERIGGATPLPSLVLGCEAPTPGVDTGFSSVYLNHISWSSPTRPTPREIHPAQAFDSLFDVGGDRKAMTSLLDQVLEDANDLGRQLSVSDRRRVDEYLSSVRDVERRVQRVESEPPAGSWRPTLHAPDLKRPADGLPSDLAEHMRLMLDIVFLAFRMDRTRIATVMFNNERSYQDFRFVPGVPGEQYHLITHSGHGHMEIIRFHAQLVADLLARMKAVDEGGSTLLDNSMILFTSCFSSGRHHKGNNLPVLLAGRGGGSLKTGRVLKYDEQNGRLMCSLLLGIMDRMGVELPEFGDAKARLSGL